MFSGLSERLEGVFGGLRRKAKLSEADVTAALREIRVALLEADVALPVAKDLMARVKEAAVGADLVKKVTADQQVIKIVNDELVKTLGETVEPLIATSAPPTTILMVGLQGSGKTTTSAKLGLTLSKKKRSARCSPLSIPIGPPRKEQFESWASKRAFLPCPSFRRNPHPNRPARQNHGGARGV